MQLLNGQMSLRLNPCYDTLVLGMFDALAKPRCLRPPSRGAWLCSIAELVERLVVNRIGTYDVHCSHFMHSIFGMKGKIVVR